MVRRTTKFFSPGKPMNWHKTQSQTMRRRNALHAHKGDCLATARALQALANVQSGSHGDIETRRKASADAKHFFAKHNSRRR